MVQNEETTKDYKDLKDETKRTSEEESLYLNDNNDLD